jgi:UDP-N-acetylglucosamine transferase subunit ALG13
VAGTDTRCSTCALRWKPAQLTMILVTTGSNGAPFDRMLLAVDQFTVDDEIVVQHGPSSVRPRGATCIDFLPFDRLGELVAKARVVVSHAGVGSILLCMTHDRVPIVVPRLARLGEVVDDHQLILARRLAAIGAVVSVEEPDDLPQVVRTASEGAAPTGGHPQRSRLTADLSRYLDSVLS